MNILRKIHNLSKKFWRSLFFNREDRCYTNNPDEKYLFVGGFNDKLVVRVPDNQWTINFPNPSHLYNPMVYRKHILFTRNSRLGIYVSSDIQENQILDKLVESYNKK